MRLFIGVELEAEARRAAAEAVAGLQHRLRRRAPDFAVRWVPPENFHITLWFIGHADESMRERIAQTLGGRPFATPAFSLSLSRTGAFPSSGLPRVIWIGVGDGCTGMRALHEELGTRLAALGMTPERRSYAPHLTVGRVKSAGPGTGAAVRQVLAAAAADCGISRVSAVTLFQSLSSAGRTSYAPLLRVPLS